MTLFYTHRLIFDNRLSHRGSHCPSVAKAFCHSTEHSAADAWRALGALTTAMTIYPKLRDQQTQTSPCTSITQTIIVLRLKLKSHIFKETK